MGTNFYYTYNHRPCSACGGAGSRVRTPCPHCKTEGTTFAEHCQRCAGSGDTSSQLHIGKSSAGWVFALRIHPNVGVTVDRPEGIVSLHNWETFWRDNPGKIRDEYGESLTVEEMLTRITDRGWDDAEAEALWEAPPHRYASWEEFHRRNHSERGPRGLVRGGSSRAGRQVPADPHATYDLCNYNFT